MAAASARLDLEFTLSPSHESSTGFETIGARVRSAATAVSAGLVIFAFAAIDFAVAAGQSKSSPTGTDASRLIIRPALAVEIPYTSTVDFVTEVSADGDNRRYVASIRYDFDLIADGREDAGGFNGRMIFHRLRGSLIGTDIEIRLDTAGDPPSRPELPEMQGLLGLCRQPSRVKFDATGSLQTFEPPPDFCSDHAGHVALLRSVQEAFAGPPGPRLVRGESWPWETTTSIVGLPVRMIARDRIDALRENSIRVLRKGKIEIERGLAIERLARR